MRLPTLSLEQQLTLYEVRRSGGLPIAQTGQGHGRTRPRKTLARTSLVEKYVGKDGTPWIRMAAAGHSFLAAIEVLNGDSQR